MEIKLNYEFEHKYDLTTWLSHIPIPYDLKKVEEIEKNYEIMKEQWILKNDTSRQ